LVVAARRKHPHVGARQLLVRLGRHYPRLRVPAARTVGDTLLKRDLLVAASESIGAKGSVARRIGTRLDEVGGAAVVWVAEFGLGVEADEQGVGVDPGPRWVECSFDGDL
jgi:hypothetical protein